MKHAVFFRNLNLGRPRCPTRAQFEAAFLAAGAESAASLLTNGTLVFEARTKTLARKVLAQASQTMAAECGLREPGFLRSVEQLAELVALDPFARVDRDSVYEVCITFLDAKHPALPALPLVSKRDDVVLLSATEGEVFSASRVVGNTPGSPNAFLEKLLGTPASTRAWNTVVRLVDKHG
ncbi:DUF1697 domain-containing protein [Variovorax sp. WS11]|uniref:DUF1697 domain-containing protein n=1 Tax=Variovorax sp. WS11 TaxID=1105204 RepID=UPI000D0D33FC|nr:DUF1697 domain-containing protein [Variovorax sp. WS11]NDZ16186.1 DUF1697 domain-containing protein [Variovorax sp. WS11]PSL83976.1 DUF1697 domain-containing protein [Variovorax sp. WS11]